MRLPISLVSRTCSRVHSNILNSTRQTFRIESPSRGILLPRDIQRIRINFLLLLAASSLTVQLSISEESATSTNDVPSFTERVKGSYENRVRNFSAPQRVFEFFASVSGPNGVFMTPEDFTRAVTPYKGKSGEDLGSKNFKFNFQARYLTPSNEQRNEYVKLLQKLVEDKKVTPEECQEMIMARQLLNIDANTHLDALKEIKMSNAEFELLMEEKGGIHRSSFFKLVDMDGDGLVSFEEYMLFHTLIAIPTYRLRLAFHLFDGDGNGTVNPQEFDDFARVLRKQTKAGKAENASVLGKKDLLTSLHAYKSLFRGNMEISLNDFISFVQSLRNAILELQFNSWDEGRTGVLSGHEFASFLASCISIDRSLHESLRSRADSSSARKLTKSVTLADFIAFHNLLEQLDALEVAVGVVGTEKGVTPDEFRHAAHAACGEHLSAGVVEALFTIFDINNDGLLNKKEFVHVLRKEREAVDPPREIGVVDFIHRVKYCAQKEFRY